MMGGVHAWSGIAAGLLILPRLPQITPGQIAVGVAVTAGAALLPDIDQPQSSVAHTFYLPGKVVAKLVGDISGGHRAATHSLLGVALIGVLAALASATATGRQLILFLMFATAAHTLLGEHLGWLTLPAAAALGWWLGSSADPRTLIAAVVIGVAVHILGDCLTTGGCPLLWPLPQRIALPILGHTGGGPEILLRFALIVAVAVLLFRQVVPPA